MSYWAGGEKMVAYYAQFLSERGYNVSIHTLPVKKRKTSVPVTSKEKFIQRVKADVAYYMYAPLIHKLIKCDCPKIAGIHSPMFVINLQHEDVRRLNPIGFYRKFGLIRFLSRYYPLINAELRSFDAIHVVSDATTFNGVKKRYVIPNGIDTSRFKPSNEKYEDFTVLFVGRREWSKGFDMFLEVAKRLNSEGIRFLSTGESVGNIVTGLGFIPEEELPIVIGKSHVVLYPSRIDVTPLPLVIMEALSCGTPVITTATPIHTSLKDKMDGILYGRDVDDFIKKVLMVREMYESGEYKKIAERGRRSIVENYDIRKISRDFERMLTEVCNNNKD